MRSLFIFTPLLWVLPFITEGQISNQRCKWVKTFDESFALDTLSIDKSSLTFINTNKSNVTFDYNINTGLIIFNSITKIDSALVCYRVFPIAMHQSIYNRSLDQYDSNAMFKDPVPLINPTDKRDELFQMEDMTKGGSIGRSISFGSNQDVFVNSTLNLTLNGKLAENLNIRASITDQNVPFQPEGNTRHLQEFDNVFIQIFSDKMSLTSGDIVLKNKPGYFLRNYKNVQGGLFTANYTLGDSTNSASTTIGASVAKGQFSSVILNVSEGVLGPYKIQGPQNQSFVIILANSERVFLDGKKLQRGFNLDYVIDYNRGEITFTNRILITKFSRVRIDYEFSDQNYSRTITSLSQYQSLGKIDFFFNVYTEKDSRNKPLISDLSQEDKIFLSNSGDAIDGNFTDQFDSIGYIPDRINYKKVDTIDIDDLSHSIFIFSNSPDSAFYNVSFVEVGPGNGNYVLKEASFNGRVYEWVSPSGGVLQGNYEALRPLVAPNKKQLLTFGGRYNINQHESISAEVGISDHNNNLFSSLDDSDNNGQALKIGFESNSRPLGSEKGYKIFSNINFEFNSRNFRAIDRFRYIEFDRDWSYNPQSLDPKFEDKILTTSINLQKDISNSISYKLVGRKKGSLVNGLQHYMSIQQLFGKLQLSSEAFLMDNDRLNDKSEWQRLKIDISFLMKHVVPGYVYGLDKNVVADLSDSVISSAMNYTSHTFYLRSPENAKTKYDARYVYRKDNLPVDGEIQPNSRSHTGSFNLTSEISERHTVGVQFIYRNLENITDLFLGRNEETISGRMDWLGSMWDNNLRMEVNYTISNSRELRREFSYLLVPTSEGTHTWRDLNDDGIQDLNEFFLAINPDEQNYIKLFVPTNDFISAFDNLLNYRLNVNFPSKWRAQGGFKEFLSRFSNNTTWTSHHKVVNSNLDARLLPFLVNLEDDDVLSVRENVRSTLFYNRSNPKFGLSITTFTNKRKQLLTSGFEARNSHGLEFTNRINITRNYNFKIISTRSVSNSSSDFLQDRDFKIRKLKLSPVISWQPSAKMRISASYSISDRRNSSDFETPGNAMINEFSTEFRLNNATKSSLIANFRFIDIEFQGEENTPLGYELLQALRPGSNLTWMVNFQKKLTSGLQINLTYEGRKSPSVDLIQIGRVQMTALF